MSDPFLEVRQREGSSCSEKVLLQNVDQIDSSVTILNGYFIVTLSYFLLTITCMLKISEYLIWPEGDSCISVW